MRSNKRASSTRVNTAAAVKKAATKHIRHVTKKSHTCGAPVLGGYCPREIEKGQQCYWHPGTAEKDDDSPGFWGALRGRDSE